MQTTSHLLMIKPVNFSFNAETAVNNAFQTESATINAQEKALTEFNDFVNVLGNQGVDVTVIDDSPIPYTPDSIFPNNWISFHSGGIICLFPMYAENRRQERKAEVLEIVARKFIINKKVDFSQYEQKNMFLEGTGSMVLDRQNRIAYACLSPRTNEAVLQEFCKTMGYSALLFHSVDAKGNAIYHTNVMMCVADRFVVVCLASIPDQKERTDLSASILNSGKEIVDISIDQMNHFAGNMLQVHNNLQEKLLVMSTQAFESLTEKQKEKLASYSRVVHSKLDTIEFNGGGSARCMLAEVYLPIKTT
jgi:hypothetical protein